MSATYPDRPANKRSSSRSPSSWNRSQKIPRQQPPSDGRESLAYRSGGATRRGRHDSDSNYNSPSYSSPSTPRGKQHRLNQRRHHLDTKDQMRLNRLQEDEQARQWVAQEDTFVLSQAKKKAEIRVKEGRAKPIDWLAVTLRVIDTTRNPLDDEISDADLDLVDPEGVLEGLSQNQLLDLERDIDTFSSLETSQKNRDFWKTMKVVCRDRQTSLSSAPQSRVLSSVAADINNILKPKSFEELEKLEVQVKRKLDSNDPIDTDYWEELLRSLTVWKARAKLKKVYQAVIEERVQVLRKQQQEEAESVRVKLAPIAPFLRPNYLSRRRLDLFDDIPESELDPEPRLNLRPEDKTLVILDESTFLEQVAHERQKVLKMGYVPLKQRNIEKSANVLPSKASVIKDPVPVLNTRFSSIPNEDFSQATKALYEREVARGVSENEEIFNAEETISTQSRPHWANKYRPRKPRYFNRVQMGYEWNKYNQTHYDHDNPPPKVVQGYKFNIFYPDLIDKTRAPTYKIEREHGRKRGQSFVPAGEEDTCLIRFIAGPPYEDIAFRIVDKEWDYSAKRDRGFRSSFEKGILQLHFQFKRIYYRK